MKPAVSQVSYTSLKSFSPTDIKKGFSAYFRSLYAENEFPFSENSSNAVHEKGLILEPEFSFKPTEFVYPENSKTDIGISEYSYEQLVLYATALKQYAKANDFDTAYAFLSNMGMLCNKKRFFVMNLRTMQIEEAGLVSHGRGQGKTIFDKQYSNQPGSRCTSLGRYKILSKYKGTYGEAYRMSGLDSSNENAFERNIVLHSMSCIPDIENIMPACVSDGCPAVSSRFLSALQKIIESRRKPMLLWIFDSNLEEIVSNHGNKYVLNEEVFASIEDKNISRPFLYDDSFGLPEIESGNILYDIDLKQKDNLFKRVITFFRNIGESIK
jgi:hypothetical protein